MGPLGAHKGNRDYQSEGYPRTGYVTPGREGKAPGQGARGLESPPPSSSSSPYGPARLLKFHPGVIFQILLPPEGTPSLVKALKFHPGSIFQILLPPEGDPWLAKALKIRPFNLQEL